MARLKGASGCETSNQVLQAERCPPPPSVSYDVCGIGVGSSAARTSCTEAVAVVSTALTKLGYPLVGSGAAVSDHCTCCNNCGSCPYRQMLFDPLLQTVHHTQTTFGVQHAGQALYRLLDQRQAHCRCKTSCMSAAWRS